MKKEIDRADKRGKGDYGWLKTRYSFSFADWYDPTRMGFGALRVLNDDWIAPGQGFGKHPHRDMEIITVVTEGAVKHEDSMGSKGVTKAGEVQVMSAGTGVVHAEWNASETEPLALFQIWINTARKNAIPRYDQRAIGELKPGLTLLVGPEGTKDALWIHQDARLYRGKIVKEAISYNIPKGHGVYVFVIDGELMVAGENLKKRDTIGISETGQAEIMSSSSADFLLIEVPMS
jgi:hypothetical protein